MWDENVAVDTRIGPNVMLETYFPLVARAMKVPVNRIKFVFHPIRSGFVEINQDSETRTMLTTLQEAPSEPVYVGVVCDTDEVEDEVVALEEEDCNDSETEDEWSEFECSLCEKTIKNQCGNIAQPTANGKACDECNAKVVSPRRMREMLEHMNDHPAQPVATQRPVTTEASATERVGTHAPARAQSSADTAPYPRTASERYMAKAGICFNWTKTGECPRTTCPWKQSHTEAYRAGGNNPRSSEEEEDGQEESIPNQNEQSFR